MRRGTFIISIDYEYAWGFTDWNLTSADFERMRGEAAITKKLLKSFETYNVPATWAIVAHLLEKDFHGDDLAWYDAEHLVDAIASSPAGHEIASHSFEHTLFDAASRDVALADIRRAKAIHEARGFPFASFIFPRNKEGHYDVLKENGIRAYRGVTKTWYDRFPKITKPLWRGLDFWLPIARTHTPRRHESGLLNIPDSLFFITRRGLQKLLPPSQLVRKMRYGIDEAVTRGEVFHLWFHPSNFSYDTETQLKIFERVLAHACSLRDKGLLDIVTMKEYTEQVSKTT
ncbi:MAG: hypothetical protein AMXMBFR44_1240 [Candidatus Campbellbacteria bacterium]